MIAFTLGDEEEEILLIDLTERFLFCLFVCLFFYFVREPFLNSFLFVLFLLTSLIDFIIIMILFDL